MNEITEPQAAPAQSALQVARERLETVREYMNDGTLVPSEDYGKIPGTSGKPTLLNPGAQKLCALFDLALEIKTVTQTETEKRLSYDVTARLVNKHTLTLEFEGVGCCNSNERKYKSQDRDNVANTLLKMAKKRALVDAVLGALGISSLLTQDLEDLADNGAMPQQGQQRPPQREYSQAPPQQAPRAVPPPQVPQLPLHITELQGRMRAAGTPFVRDTAAQWLTAINTYLNKTGDAPPLTTLRDLTPEIAGEVGKAIEEKLCVFQAPEPAEVTA
jgi:hypothetical protein